MIIVITSEHSSRLRRRRRRRRRRRCPSPFSALEACGSDMQVDQPACHCQSFGGSPET